MFHLCLIIHSFSNFPSRYFSLSLNLYYLALEDGSPIFRQVFSHRTYFCNNINYVQDFLTFFGYGRVFLYFDIIILAIPISLTITFGVSVDFLSFPYYNDLLQEVFI